MCKMARQSGYPELVFFILSPYVTPIQCTDMVGPEPLHDVQGPSQWKTCALLVLRTWESRPTMIVNGVPV